jgi:hypothetical protein
MKLFVLVVTCLFILSACNPPSKHILVQNQYFPKSGKEEEVYKLRLHASEVIKKLGLRNGRVLKRMNVSDRPYVEWECEYSSLEEREKDIKIVGQSRDFQQVEEKMGTLLDNFERVIWEISD